MNIDIILRSFGLDKEQIIKTADGFGARMERLERMVGEIHAVVCSDKKENNNGPEKTDTE
jgi:hypothetical protein